MLRIVSYSLTVIVCSLIVGHMLGFAYYFVFKSFVSDYDGVSAAWLPLSASIQAALGILFFWLPILIYSHVKIVSKSSIIILAVLSQGVAFLVYYFTLHMKSEFIYVEYIPVLSSIASILIVEQLRDRFNHRIVSR